MSQRLKTWHGRGKEKWYGDEVDLYKWEEEAAIQRNLSQFYRQELEKSFKERIRKFFVRIFLSKKCFNGHLRWSGRQP